MDASLFGKYTIEGFHKIKRSGRSYVVLTSWKGYDDPDNNTWEPLMRLHADVPSELSKFLSSTKLSPKMRKDIASRLKRADARLDRKASARDLEKAADDSEQDDS